MGYGQQLLAQCRALWGQHATVEEWQRMAGQVTAKVLLVCHGARYRYFNPPVSQLRSSLTVVMR